MNQEHPVDDVFEKRLADWADRLEKGESIQDTVNGDSTELLDKKLNRGLACLKQLNNIRRRHIEAPTTQISKSAELSITPIRFKLPCRFGKFDLLSELGRGGFGVVFLARDRVLDCQVALKMPHAHVLTNVQLRERFIREARVAAGLQHSHIVAVHEAGEVGRAHTTHGRVLAPDPIPFLDFEAAVGVDGPDVRDVSVLSGVAPGDVAGTGR